MRDIYSRHAAAVPIILLIEIENVRAHKWNVQKIYWCVIRGTYARNVSEKLILTFFDS